VTDNRVRSSSHSTPVTRSAAGRLRRGPCFDRVLDDHQLGFDLRNIPVLLRSFKVSGFSGKRAESPRPSTGAARSVSF
jgi:hypothetical protein